MTLSPENHTTDTKLNAKDTGCRHINNLILETASYPSPPYS